MCGESVNEGLIACPKCGGGIFRIHSNYKETLQGVFVSSSRADLPKAQALVDALTAKHISVWWDRGVFAVASKSKKLFS